MPHNWGSMIYFLVAGGVVFLFGLIVPIVKGDIHLYNNVERRSFWKVAQGGLIFVVFYIAWQLYAIYGAGSVTGGGAP